MPGQGPYGERINRGIDYVLIHQQANGLLSNQPQSQPMYDHGISTIMLCECYGMVDEARRKKIDKAIASAVWVILEAQNVPKNADETGGWRYTKDENDSDISVSGWQLMALRAAANNGAAVPQAALEKGVAYIRRRAGADGGFSYQGNGSATPARTGTGVLALTLLGQHDSREAQAGGEYLITHPPSAANDQFYFYAVYYCSQAANQLGDKYWNKIYPPIVDSLIHSQKQTGAWSGGAAETQAGDVYPTAMALLALSVPYRSLPIYQR